MDRIANSRRLRRELTDAERKLWSIVRNRQLDGFKFRRQVAIDRFFADFACRDAMLIVELDGGQHAEAEVYDANRTKVLEAQGWHVLRFWNKDVLNEPDGVVGGILAALRLSRNEGPDV